MSTDGRPAGKRHGGFATTRWSLVLAAGDSGAGGSGCALAELCEQYWQPLYAYVRRRGYDPEDARDLTQSFFTRLLEQKNLKAADPERGRFRTFLLSSMQNFLADEWRKENALKRGGGVEILSLDFDSAEETYKLEPSSDLTPEAMFERRWALSLLERAMADLQNRYTQAGDLELFDALKGHLAGEAEVAPYAELSRRLGRSEAALRTAASRLRSRWRKRLRELVAETVHEELEVHDELETLIDSVGSGV